MLDEQSPRVCFLIQHPEQLRNCGPLLGLRSAAASLKARWNSGQHVPVVCVVSGGALGERPIGCWLRWLSVNPKPYTQQNNFPARKLQSIIFYKPDVIMDK